MKIHNGHGRLGGITLNVAAIYYSMLCLESGLLPTTPQPLLAFQRKAKPHQQQGMTPNSHHGPPVSCSSGSTRRVQEPKLP